MPCAIHPRSSQKICSVSVEPTRSKRGFGIGSTRCFKLPLCANIQSRRANGRWNGCVFAAVMLPQVAVRMWSTKSEDSRCSHARINSLLMLPGDGAGSFNTAAAGSPPG